MFPRWFTLGRHSIRSQISALLAFAVVLQALSLPANAIDAPAPLLLQSTSTDGKNYGTTFTVNLTAANSTASLASALVDQAVQITATYTPGTAHANQLVDIFVVDRMDNAWYMRTLDGRFVPWNFSIPALQPAQEHVKLVPGLKVEVYSGTYSTAATHNIYVGYMVVGGSALIYTPLPAAYAITGPTIKVAPLTYFSDHIENDILPRCLACHFSGGLAKDSMLILERSSATSAKNNFDTFARVAQAKGIGYILTKVTGGNSHTGGVQLNQGSTDYNNLSTFLQLQQGTTEVITVTGNDFFNGVTLQNRPETLRRAAIMLAGRAPTQTETDAVSKGDETTLRTTLRSMMTGDGFHKFLVDGANDRLLVRGVLGQVIDSNYPFYPKYTTEIYNARVKAQAQGKSQADIDSAGWNLMSPVESGLRRSVEELVAYVAEADKPYTEVLTADYMMMSPAVSFMMDGGITFKNANDPNEYKPGKINNSYLLKPGEWNMLNDKVLGYHFSIQPTVQHTWEHVGILNNPAFLTRYPSTATNRNRARARWTMFHFLDIDIEKSTQRPTDPAALADRNNPTLNNAACAACHERMDPVAATYQNYSDQGFYKMDFDDSLDNFYKYPADQSISAYKKGDTWYRDMRPAGLLGQSIATTNEPLKQLVALIIKDQGFARATVKFWWPAVMNSEVLLSPAVASDSDYQAKLTAYQAQATSIEQFATNFRKDYNLKNLLVDMLMSPWFRAKTTTDTTQRAALAIADVGVEKLLTPERLQRKSAALTGFNWGSSNKPSDPYTVTTNLGDIYNGLYGGIDSQAVITRSRDITPLMSTVAQSFALESACPIVLKEFALPETLRKLFTGLNQNITPLWQGSTSAEVTSTSATDWKTLTLSVDLNAGTNLLTLAMDNPYCDFDQAAKKCITQRILYLDRFEIKVPGQSSFVPFEITSTMIKNFPSGCYGSGLSDAVTYGSCAIPLQLTAPVTGKYEIRAIVAGVQASTGNIQASLAVREVGDPLLSKSRGATLIRQKLVELYSKLHGKTYALDAPEITAAYQLFVDTLQEKSTLNAGGNLSGGTKTCAWYGDMNFLDGLGYSGNQRVIKTNNGYQYYDWDNPAVSTFVYNLGNDTLYVKQSWMVVMAYLLGHYNFLYE